MNIRTITFKLYRLCLPARLLCCLIICIVPEPEDDDPDDDPEPEDDPEEADELPEAAAAVGRFGGILLGLHLSKYVKLKLVTLF